MPLQAWDIAFWSERFRQSELRLSDEQLKPYFPLQRMLEALRHTSERLLGIRLVRDEEVATWHPEVEFHWVAVGRAQGHERRREVTIPDDNEIRALAIQKEEELRLNRPPRREHPGVVVVDRDTGPVESE